MAGSYDGLNSPSLFGKVFCKKAGFFSIQIDRSPKVTQEATYRIRGGRQTNLAQEQKYTMLPVD